MSKYKQMENGMKIRSMMLMLIFLAIGFGCQAGKTQRIVDDSHFESLSRPPLVVNVEGGFQYLKPSERQVFINDSSYNSMQKGKAKTETYYYVKHDENNMITNAILIQIDTFKSDGWRWNPISFRGNNVLSADNHSEGHNADYKNAVILIDSVGEEYVERAREMGYTLPDRVLEKCFGKVTGPGDSQRIFVSYIDSVELPQYEGIDWSDAMSFNGPDREKAIAILNANCEKYVHIQ